MIAAIVAFVAGMYGHEWKKVLGIGFLFISIFGAYQYTIVSADLYKSGLGNSPIWVLPVQIVVSFVFFSAAFFAGRYVYRRRKKGA